MRARSPLVLLTVFLLLAAFPGILAYGNRAANSVWLATPAATQSEDSPVPDSELQYRVALVADKDVLNIRAAAGVQAAIVDSLANAEIVQPLSAGQRVGDDLWVPIQYHDNKSGWVNRSYLIATRDRAAFCDDPRPKKLIAALQTAVQKLDSLKFSQLVAPRGLYITLDGDKTLFLLPAEARRFFQDNAPRDWGHNGNTEKSVSGTLADKVTKLLQKNLTPTDVSLSIACNDNQDDLSDKQVLEHGFRLPGMQSEREISNFYSVVRPGPPGNDLDWAAWGLAIEYWNGQPVLTGLVYYYWTP